ncbi:response regulator [Paenibacillus sp. FJAT-26967]|uniref:response regulator n=1 Tax=Paenibacillus sp. FJAT-26967 TaxID=1729690 RepID=UPI000837DE47|nr:response regulator [Paenibacillus sp. FJAT-26967]
MKALIIDDEAHVRETIRLLVDWDRFGITEVYEAASGEEGIELLQQEKPGLVFTDIMMPGMTGLDVLSRIAESGIRSKAIVISGYDDFTYVRSALQFGSFDYLLKPIDEEELEDAVRKAVAAWLDEENERSERLQSETKANLYRPMLADKSFVQLLLDPDQYPMHAATLQREFGIGSDQKQVLAAVVSLQTLDTRLQAKFASAMDLLLFAVTNICSEFMSKENLGLAFRHWHRHEAVLLFFDRFEKAGAMLEQINEGLYAALRGQFHLGYGTVQPFPSGIQRTFHEAETALQLRNMRDQTAYLHPYELRKQAAHMLQAPLAAYEDRLVLAVRMNDLVQIGRSLEDWESQASKHPYLHIRQLEMWWQEFTLMHSRLLLENEVDDEGEELLSEADDLSFRLPLNDLGQPDLTIWTKRMERILTEIAGFLLRGDRNPVMRSIEKYIRLHYREQIPLEKLSETFHLSPSHISRSFKTEFGETLTDYVTRLRINKAKLLLADPELKITSIAEAVGYQDEKYFSRAFKKLEGVSPNMFRKQHLAAPLSK